MLVALSLLFADHEDGWYPQRVDPPAEEARGGSQKKGCREKATEDDNASSVASAIMRGRWCTQGRTTFQTMAEGMTSPSPSPH